MELKDRLLYLMNRRGVKNAAELARMTGLTQVAIRNYLRGIKVPNAQALIRLSRALTSTSDYLLSGSALRPDRIPLLTKIPGGSPTNWTDGEYPAGYGYEFIDRGDIADSGAFALVVEGNSMSPSINSGDIVIVSPGTPVTNRTIAAIAINGDERTLKRVLFLDDDRVLLQPDNDAYTPIVCDRNDITLIGRVIERRQRI